MPGPLEGVKVLSFGRALAGPFAAMLLSDLGAEVVKIEEPQNGDTARRNGPFIDGLGSYFLSVNRGKKSITFDLRNEQAKKTVIELTKRADILIENFRPGVMARLGLDYEAIRNHNPEIIYASISGFGQKGPYAHRPAFDMLAQGMGGTVSITGEPGSPPTRVGYSIGDMGASMFAVMAILAALHEVKSSGEGQWIDVAMVDSQVALCENACARYFATGKVPRPFGSRHPLLTPFQVFPTKDGYIVLIAAREGEWEKFCRAIGEEGWITDERFRSNEARLRNYAEYEQTMNEMMRTRTTEEWMGLFDAHDIMCGPVNNIEQVVQDPHIRERDMVLEVEHSRLGTLKVTGTPMKFSRTACRIEKASPELGEHTTDVLSTWLGLTERDIQNLRESKAI
jgi:crotonobetainyl-CoA:carnitine CoA-transferase CaiB-like acyl-CoA transferase